MSPNLKTSYDKYRTISPLHTAGPVAISTDGAKLFTCIGEEVILTDVDHGTEIGRFSGDTESINSFCISPCSTFLLVFSASLSLRIFRIPSSSEPFHRRIQPERVITRAHEAPVHVSKVDPTSTYLASGSADGVIKVWDIRKGYITHVFKGHGGVISALAFNYHRDPSNFLSNTVKMQLITGCVDTKIRIFDLSAAASRTEASSKPDAVLEGHVSVPRGLDVSQDGNWLASGGRDSVVMLWDLSSMRTPKSHQKNKGKGKDISPRLVKTVPVLEPVEALGLIQPEDDSSGPSTSDGLGKLRFYVAGEKGVVSVWDCQKGSILFTLGKESSAEEESRQILNAIYVPSKSTIVSVHGDQNILFHSIAKQKLTRQFIGFNDEIIDSTFLSKSSEQRDSHLAIATNSSLIRVYDTSTLDPRLLEGHTDIVLCLDRGSDCRLLASGSKDSSARIWAPSSVAEETQVWGCVAICDGHGESVGAVALSRQGNAKFLFTGSQDRTIKMWNILSVPSFFDAKSDAIKCKSLCTVKAHEKDINSLDVAPNDRLLASGSQDRLAKIYEIDYSSDPARGSLNLVGTCKGHKRGVWCVRFGRHEKVLATASGDKTVKLWSLTDFSCLKTFEGHGNSVLRVDFLSEGSQMVSCGSDGLVKVWNVRTEECVTTMDNHEDKVWTLAVSYDEKTIVSGAADSVITFWKDCTEEKENKKQLEKAELVSKEQNFSNYVLIRDYQNAMLLALAMEQPGRLLSVFKTLRLVEEPMKSLTGSTVVDEVIKTMAGNDLAKLLKFVRGWNSNAKTSGIAQEILSAIVKLRTADELTDAFVVSGTLTSGGAGLKDVLDGLIPYTERHLARMERLVQESYMVDFLLEEMDDGLLAEPDLKPMTIDMY